MLETDLQWLGAMYGDFGFRIPSEPEEGHLDADAMNTEFLVGDGKMIRRSRVQNTRISVLITVQEYSLRHLTMKKYVRTDDGRTNGERGNDILSGIVDMRDYEATQVGVTVWENATTPKKLLHDMFRGEMDYGGNSRMVDKAGHSLEKSE